MDHTTIFELDLENPELLTYEQQAELDSLASRPEAAINYTDIPPVSDESSFYRPRKEGITVYLDSDVLDWLRARGQPDYEKINAIFRQVMQESKKNKF